MSATIVIGQPVNQSVSQSVNRLGLTSQNSPSSKVILQHLSKEQSEGNNNYYGYWLIESSNPDYKNLGKIVFELHANHEDSDVSEKFLKMIERALNGVLSMSTMDGDHEEVLIVWRTTPRDYYLEDMKNCIRSAWKFLTAFDVNYQQ